MQTSNERSSLKTSVSRVAKNGWNKLRHQMQCTSTSIFHFVVQLNNSQGDPKENEDLKGTVTLLVGENVLCCWVTHQSEVEMCCVWCQILDNKVYLNYIP